MKRQVLTLQKYVLGEVSRSTQQQPIVQISLNVRLKCSLEILGIQAQPTHGPIYDLKSQLFAVMLEMIKASQVLSLIFTPKRVKEKCPKLLLIITTHAIR